MHHGRATFVIGLEEPPGAQAPAIARFETRKVELGAWRAQVVSNIFRIREKLGRHDCANSVAALILGAGVARPVPEKTGQGIARAGSQNTPQHIYAVLLLHDAILQALRNFAEHFDIFFVHARLAKVAVCPG